MVFDPFADAIERAAAEIPRALLRPEKTREEWLQDPAGWALEKTSTFLWSKQREEMEAVRDHRRVAVHSCHSTGKTKVAACIAAWWIDSHEPGTAMVLTTAPTAVQVKVLLWREINRLHRTARLDGRVNLTEWYVGNEMVAFGRKPNEYDESSFQGVHAMYVLVIFDEACGIPESIWTGAESVASNRHSRILVIGNPDDNDSEFAKVCAPESNWHKIKIGYEDTPNFTGEHVPDDLKDLLISEEWVDERKQAWGEDSALFQSKCAGVFPDRALDTWSVVPYGMASRCRLLELELDLSQPIEVGVDVGGGGDRTVSVARQGKKVLKFESFRNPDPMETVGQLVEFLNEVGADKVKVDSGGIGWGIFGRLKELSSFHNPSGVTSHKAEVVPVNFGSKSKNPHRFLNKRAEMWWNGRELSRLGGWDLGACTDEVIAELTAPRYEILDSYGKIKVEPKDDIIGRIGKSPDYADALLLAFYEAAGGTADTSAVATFGTSTLVGRGTGSGVSTPFGGGGIFGGRGRSLTR